MPIRAYRFDDYLSHVRSDELKPMARLWGGRSQLRKDDCLALIRKGLQDPAQARAAVASLAPYERTALALIKQLGGDAPIGALGVALRASGVPLPASRHVYSEDASTLIQPLIRRGLILTGYSYDPASTYGMSHGHGIVFSDERLLEHIGPPDYAPLAIKPGSPPAASVWRRPPTVVLDVLGVLQAVENIGDLPRTKSGAIHTSAVRQLTRALRWKQDLTVDGLNFPNPASAFIEALLLSSLLKLKGETLVLREPTARFATRSYAEQVSALLEGFMLARAWTEWPEHPWYGSEGEYQIQGRLALMVTLARLPAASGFFALDDLDQAVFKQIGEYFSLNYPPHRPYYYNKTPDEIRQEEAKRLAKLRADWQARERPWFQRALSTWLYYLGIVELGLANGVPVSLRLTDLGRAVLRPELHTSPEPSAPDQPPWIVQPNFDVIVYLDRTTPEQLAFLERHAERVTAQQHTAQYRLTRESVYRGLESGTSLETLLSDLQDGAVAVLPQNIVVEIHAWASLRESITLHKRARLIEFPSSQAREQAASKQWRGAPVGERFWLLTGPAPQDLDRTRIDYARPLPACLTVAEDGALTFKQAATDLIIRPQLGRWAERKSEQMWRLTQASVTQALAAGARLPDLFRLLEARLVRSIPALLETALRAWAGKRPTVEMENVIVLRCDDPQVLQILAASKKLRPYLRGFLAPDALIVNAEQLEALQEQLAWAGIRMADSLALSALDDPDLAQG
jgi:hypothetical protein